MNLTTASLLCGSCAGCGLLALLIGLPHRADLPPNLPADEPDDEQAQESHRPVQLRNRWPRLPRRALTAAAVGVVVWPVTGWPVGGLAAAAGVLGLPPLLHPQRPAQALAHLDALAAWTRRLADLLASGAGGLEQALAYTTDTTPAPLQRPVQRLTRRLPIIGVEAALRGFADELADADVDDVVACLILRSRAGGRGLTEILRAQATALSQQATARRQIEATRATPRAAVRSLVWITVLMLTGLILFARDYLAPFATLTGQVVLAGITATLAAALAWMHTMATPTRQPRSLVHTPLPAEAGDQS